MVKQFTVTLVKTDIHELSRLSLTEIKLFKNSKKNYSELFDKNRNRCRMGFRYNDNKLAIQTRPETIILMKTLN